MSQERDELSHALEAVHDEESFLQFLLALRDDREAAVEPEKVTPNSPYGADGRGWENNTIERFFDTAVRWARDSVNGNPFYKRPENPWRRCAHILFAATGYEKRRPGLRHNPPMHWTEPAVSFLWFESRRGAGAATDWQSGASGTLRVMDHALTGRGFYRGSKGGLDRRPLPRPASGDG